MSDRTLQHDFLPSSTPLPNWYFDDLYPDADVPDSVLRVFAYLYRQTVGWNKPSIELSLSTILKGVQVARASAVYPGNLAEIETIGEHFRDGVSIETIYDR